MRRSAEASVTVEHVMGSKSGRVAGRPGLTFKLSLNSVLRGGRRERTKSEKNHAEAERVQSSVGGWLLQEPERRPGLGAPERRRSGVQGFHRGQCRWWRHAGLRQDDLRNDDQLLADADRGGAVSGNSEADEQPPE